MFAFSLNSEAVALEPRVFEAYYEPFNGEYPMYEYGFDQEIPIPRYKRRIGLGMPNLLILKRPIEEHNVNKRRIGKLFYV
jgi:hypothetical protein